MPSVTQGSTPFWSALSYGGTVVASMAGFSVGKIADEGKRPAQQVEQAGRVAGLADEIDGTQSRARRTFLSPFWPERITIFMSGASAMRSRIS